MAGKCQQRALYDQVSAGQTQGLLRICPVAGSLSEIRVSAAPMPRLRRELGRLGGMLRSSEMMSCEEKARLIEDHSLKALAYARAARALQRNRGTALPAERAQLKALTDKTRFESKEARRRVQQHIAEHGC